jgi:5-methylcytosine-specific restriction enzyme A
MLASVCAACGATYERDHTHDARCTDCRPTDQRDRQPTRREAKRGYDWSWRKLSRRARKLQPFCSDCGSPYDLTTDHSEQAWQRHERGLPIRLVDVDVVCRPCNVDRGPARGTDASDHARAGTRLDQLDQLAARLGTDELTELDQLDD